VAAALAGGRPGPAALDVSDVEPLPPGASGLVGRENVVATPHVGFVTREELDLQFSVIFEQVHAFAAGEPTHVVDPDVLGHRRAVAG
jgi:D-3-phosphoglycerate dehydrogenase